jgi:Domain of unknown function (DUF6471)
LPSFVAEHGDSRQIAAWGQLLKRGTFSAVFFLACIAALELEQVVFEEI